MRIYERTFELYELVKYNINKNMYYGRNDDGYFRKQIRIRMSKFTKIRQFRNKYRYKFTHEIQGREKEYD